MNSNHPVTRLTLATLLGFAVFATSWSGLSAQDWPHWRGPEQNGISREANLPEHFEFGEEGKEQNVIWSSDIGGRATPIVMNGRVFLNCRTHKVRITPPPALKPTSTLV